MSNQTNNLPKWEISQRCTKTMNKERNDALGRQKIYIFFYLKTIYLN